MANPLLAQFVSIDEPFQLTSYSSSSYRGKQKQKRAQQLHIFANHVATASSRKSKSKSKGRGEGLVTVAAQADGIHLVDISSLHSVASHTLGPSTSFSCPALSLGEDESEYATYAVIEASPDLSDEDEEGSAGRVVWKWKESLLSSSSTSAAGKEDRIQRVIASQNDRIHGLYATPDLVSSHRILALTGSGGLILLDSGSLEQKASISILNSEEETTLDVHRVFVFSSSSCSFGPKHAAGATAVIVSFERNGSEDDAGKSGLMNVHVVSIDSITDELAVSGWFKLALSHEILDVSCSTSGCFSVLCKDGTWASHTFPPSSPPSLSQPQPLRPLSRPFKLGDTFSAFLSSSSSSSRKSTTDSTSTSSSAVSIASLTSTYVLLAALSSGHGVHIQIWDLQYSAVLSSHTLPLPSSTPGAVVSVKLVVDNEDLVSAEQGQDGKTGSSGVRGQAVLVVSSTTTTTSPDSGATSKSKSSSNSSLFVVPYLVPTHSSLALALGRGQATQPWLSSPSDDSSTTPAGASGREEQKSRSKAEIEREKMLEGVKVAIDGGKVKVAEGAFLQWVKNVEEGSKGAVAEKKEAKAKKEKKKGGGEEMEVDGDDDTAQNEKQQEQQEQQQRQDLSVLLDYNFVKDLLGVLLPPLKAPLTVQQQQQSHAKEIVKLLLERKAVSSGMVEGGLLRAVRDRGDWASIELCFSSLVDIPESDMIETLVVLIKYHQHQQQQNDTNAMHVDSSQNASSSIPSLARYLGLVTIYPTLTSKPLVVALKRWIRDPQDALDIAKVVEQWLRVLGQQRKANGEVGLLPSNKDLEKNKDGVWVASSSKGDAKKNSKRGKEDVLPLSKVISFLQAFLDSTFLLLLQHPPSHKTLHLLQSHLIEESSFSDTLQQLRGSLEPFAIGHQKSVKEAAVPEKEKERQRQKGDWRQRRAGQAAAMGSAASVGVYQVEEMVL
ncbi:hypothetical protein EST38_g6484 [Candolleomyces aberdarensis]|uniref:Uncharacterized protein n=1 Tax=Candolleomyces aberdarensis TaxID=2316362 RepID=A0A4Q2DKW9_9AGAR|nr:hypothetical protein EST38_g6484 [Candolleomyces aberdarensis]